ncbi:MAG TPA: flavin reductase family protein [Thermoplasmata archaeon]|nr:flavin reductase family protein [Thermoplasmata archaeon]
MAAPAPAPVDPNGFRALISRWATGVAVVTARDGTSDAGLTVNALTSISLHPPSVLVSLMRDVDTLPLIERSRRFAVSLLAADQRALSERFASPVPSAEKFRNLPLHRGPDDLPLPDGALGALACRVTSLTPTFDHVLVVGEVVWQEVGREAPPLLFYRSGYGEPDPEGRVRLAPSRRP